MARNSELIRQWTVLQRLCASRTSTIPRLAADLQVSTRTVRRDLDALQLAGFPIYDEEVNGTKFWRMESKPLGTLARSGLTFAELSALYFSRALIEGLADMQLLGDLQTALHKFEAALSPAMKKFLDRLPCVISAKPERAKKQDALTHETTARLLEAILSQRVVSMQYRSVESGRQKLYVIHPHRVIHAQGGLYLIAFVPAYADIRTFAIERIKRATVLEERFEPVAELEVDPFKNSLGVHRGPTSTVQISFDRQIAESVKERTWHLSQRFTDRPDGSVVMTLEVCDDYALRSWILGFGHFVQVLAPSDLVAWTTAELDATRDRYAASSIADDDGEIQPSLPFLFGRLASA